MRVALVSAVLLVVGSVLVLAKDEKEKDLAVAEAKGTPKNIETKHPGLDDKCAEYCDKTYAPHTSEQPKSAKACKQGCRLFSMLQFAQDGMTHDVIGVRKSCSDDCTQAYQAEETKSACEAGCNNQSPFTGGKMEMSMSADSPVFKFAHDAFDGVFDRMDKMHQSMMNGGLHDFFHGGLDDLFGDMSHNGMMERANKHMAQMRQRMNSMMQSMMGSSQKHSVDDRNPLFNYAQKMGGRPVFPENARSDYNKLGNSNDNGEPVLIVHMIGNDGQDFPNTLDSLFERPHEPSPPLERDLSGYGRDPIDPADNWMACLARRARRLGSVTRWLLCVALFLCIMCMIWICLAIMRTAPRRRVLMPKNTAKMPPNSEVVYDLPGSTGYSEKKFLVDAEQMPAVDSPPPPYEAESADAPILHARPTPPEPNPAQQQA